MASSTASKEKSTDEKSKTGVNNVPVVGGAAPVAPVAPVASESKEDEKIVSAAKLDAAQKEVSGKALGYHTGKEYACMLDCERLSGLLTSVDMHA